MFLPNKTKTPTFSQLSNLAFFVPLAFSLYHDLFGSALVFLIVLFCSSVFHLDETQPEHFAVDIAGICVVATFISHLVVSRDVEPITLSVMLGFGLGALALMLWIWAPGVPPVRTSESFGEEWALYHTYHAAWHVIVAMSLTCFAVAHRAS